MTQTLDCETLQCCIQNCYHLVVGDPTAAQNEPLKKEDICMKVLFKNINTVFKITAAKENSETISCSKTCLNLGLTIAMVNPAATGRDEINMVE